MYAFKLFIKSFIVKIGFVYDTVTACIPSAVWYLCANSSHFPSMCFCLLQFVIKSPWVSPHFSDHGLSISLPSLTLCVHIYTFHTSNTGKRRLRRRCFPVFPLISIQNQTSYRRRTLISSTAITWNLFSSFTNIKEVLNISIYIQIYPPSPKKNNNKFKLYLPWYLLIYIT